jgi:hypothetical protein
VVGRIAHRPGGTTGADTRDPACLLNHLICPLQEAPRDRQAEGLGRLQIDGEPERAPWFRTYRLLCPHRQYRVCRGGDHTTRHAAK